MNGYVNKDLNRWFNKGDEVIINIVDKKSQLYYVYNLENDKSDWLMARDVDIDSEY